MRRRPLIAAALVTLLCIGQAGVAPAQGADRSGAIRMLNQSRLYAESQFARRVLGVLGVEADEIRAENARIQAELEAEEQSLTDRRPDLPADEFRALATAFDERAVRMRERQLQRRRDLQAWEEAETRRFFEAVRPVLLDLLEQEGAAVLLDERSAILAAPGFDLTDRAVAAIDAAIGDGAAGAPALPTLPEIPAGPP